jgi:threonine-phosphate decarboxylase
MTAIHGGDLTGIGRAFGCDPASLLDFSANVNPLGPPPAVAAVLRAAAAHPSTLAAYPDPHARELVAAIAARERMPADRVVVTNGGTGALDAAVRALAPRRCIVLIPAFSEYARALWAAGAELAPLVLFADDDFTLDVGRVVAVARSSGADACIVSNPHNPTGRGAPADEIAALAGALERIGCAAIVDEAFVDYLPELSLLAQGRPLGPRTVVLRSLTKFFAIPGLRVGYAFAAEPLAARMRAMLPSWPVGTLEQQAAVAALADTAYAVETRRRNIAAREQFVGDLEGIGWRVFAPAADFVLCDAGAVCKDVRRLRDRLIVQHGIVIRTFEHEPALAGGQYVRLAVRLPHDNARLVAALRSER